MLERLMNVVVFAIQAISFQQECVNDNVRVTVSGPVSPSISPQWSMVRNVDTGVATYIADIERDSLTFRHAIGEGTRIVLFEGQDYILELVRAGDSDDFRLTHRFTTITCTSP